VDCFGFGGQQLPQHVWQNPPVGVVLRLLRRIDAHGGGELGRLPVRGRAHLDLAAGREVLDELPNPRNFEDFFSRQLQRFRVLARQELQGKNSHPHQVRAVNALVALGHDRVHAQQPRTLGRPVARRA
jgi:hypothetical protein